jgi:hypothetical protein
MRAHYAVTSSWRLPVIAHRAFSFSIELIMLAIRLYISALTLFFLFLVIANRGLGILQAVVITCAVVYLILDVRNDLQMLKGEFRILQDLEQRISELLRQNS